MVEVRFSHNKERRKPRQPRTPRKSEHVKTEAEQQILRKYADQVDKYDQLNLDNKKLMRTKLWAQAEVLFENATSIEEDEKAKEFRSLVSLLREITPELRYLYPASLDEVLCAIEEDNPDVERMWYRGSRGDSFKNSDFVQKVREREEYEKTEEYAEHRAEILRNFEVYNARRRILAEYEPYIAVENELRKLVGIRWALDDDYMYYLLEKYKGLTEEERRQRYTELMDNQKKNEEEQKEQKELSDYSIASFNASMPYNKRTNVIIEPNTKEYMEVKQAIEEIAQIRSQMYSAMVVEGNEDLMKASHQMAETNKLVSVLQLSKDAEERLQGYPKRNEDRLRQLRRLPRLVDMP